MSTTSNTHVQTAIIGSGFGGIGMAIRIKQSGDTDFVVFERASEIGGTWQVNTYPGAQCDIPSTLYSFSFAPNPDWTRLYPLQSELKEYIERCVDDFGVRGHILLGHEVTSAEWDDLAQMWKIAAGGRTFTATFLVGATGPFSEPSVPELPGIEEFEGPSFHSARWNHEVDLRGKRVGVVGTGASSVQFVPQIQPKVSKLVLFQRTPTWIVPHPDRPVSPFVRTLFRRVPVVQSVFRMLLGLVQEMMVPGLVYRPAILELAAALGRWHLRRQVGDPVLREKLTPTYAFGCKRPTFSNAYYPALAAANAEVETSGIARVTRTGIETADGTVHELDAIVYGTGFTLAGHPGLTRVRGKDGRSLADAWEGGEMKAYLGTVVSGFPNFFMILGPNSVVYTSQVVTIEAQVAYILDAIRQMREKGIRSIDVLESTQQRFTDNVDRRLAHSVWNTGGCKSYYLSPSGRNITFWPGFVFTFERRMRHARLEEFDVRYATTHPADATAAQVVGR